LMLDTGFYKSNTFPESKVAKFLPLLSISNSSGFRAYFLKLESNSY
jgi:hypothetical protein